MKVIAVLFLILIPSVMDAATSKTSLTARKIFMLKTKLKEQEVETIASAINKSSKKYGISPDIFLSIIKTESNFDQKAVSPTGDISIAQINFKVWNKEFKRLKLPAINEFRLKTDPVYSISIMGKILSICKTRYSHKDPQWFARYHSNTTKYRTVYLNKLTNHKKIIATN